MKPFGTPATRFTASFLVSCLALTPMLAQAQNNKSESAKATQGSTGTHFRVDSRATQYRFNDTQRTEIRNYYSEQIRGGKCPPGLAKKNNGCQPPGQAKKWMVGRTLPPDVIYYSVPPHLSIYLGTAPTGHRFVRVATDILLIAIGTGIVIDAIESLDR